MCGLVVWLRPGSPFVFKRHLGQTYRTHRTQGIMYADVYASLARSECITLSSGSLGIRTDPGQMERLE